MIGGRVRQTHGQILSPYDGRNCWVLYLLDSHYADEGLGENYHHKILTMDIISSAINNNGSGQASFVNLRLWSPGGPMRQAARYPPFESEDLESTGAKWLAEAQTGSLWHLTAWAPSGHRGKCRSSIYVSKEKKKLFPSPQWPWFIVWLCGVQCLLGTPTAHCLPGTSLWAPEDKLSVFKYWGGGTKAIITESSVFRSNCILLILFSFKCKICTVFFLLRERIWWEPGCSWIH